MGPPGPPARQLGVVVLRGRDPGGRRRAPHRLIHRGRRYTMEPVVHHDIRVNGYLDKLSDEVPWEEMVRATARYWLGINITPNSFAGQKDWISKARKSSSYGGENWRRTPDLAKLGDLPREEAIRVATLIYGWSAAEAAERVDTEQGRYTEGR